ncbi:DUF3040 domain-containing protein [Nonomuraea sp. SYSU D8015]|uniref:DUF3040 domain-containing protein n=1 Tax=Nonomuraea sp. SYSU D8015 TaxID=2593644 RepID=UPI001660B970|nr:DUF3040 domain-containing protein [Nonomuraea sp. SYSU D8015]
MRLPLQEQLILAAIEKEFRRSVPRLAGRLDAFSARAHQEGPQRFAPHVSRGEILAILGIVLVLSALMTIMVVATGDA